MYLLQALIFCAVVGSNIQWHWTPNPYLAAGIGLAWIASRSGVIAEAIKKGRRSSLGARPQVIERSLIRKRCQAGIERAKAKGTKFGRPTALDAGERTRIGERNAAGETIADGP